LAAAAAAEATATAAGATRRLAARTSIFAGRHPPHKRLCGSHPVHAAEQPHHLGGGGGSGNPQLRHVGGAAPRRRVAARRHGGGVADAVERGGQRRSFDEARVGDRHRRAAGEEVEARGRRAREGSQRRLGLADAGSDEGGASTGRCVTTTPTSVGNTLSDKQHTWPHRTHS